MDLKSLFRDYNIQYSTEGKNCKPGWINIRCPFCNDRSNHLGGSLESGAFHCWRCGAHDTAKVLCKILNIDHKTALGVIHKYKGKRRKHDPVPTSDQASGIATALRENKLVLPGDCSPGLEKGHISYLVNRNFEPFKLAMTWDLQSTGPLAYLKEIDYRFRILIPIEWEGTMVSYQARDITGKAELRYLACPKDHEIIHHKDILYMHRDIGDVAICVEGITDVWRLGKNAFATFGIEFTGKQVREIAKRFKKVYVLFDSGRTAQAQACKLVNELTFRGVEAEQILMVGDLNADDPADLDPEVVKTFLATIF